MSYSEVRSYLTSKDIPKLFTSLMAGLMYNRPEDHIKYLQSCLEQAQNGNVGKFQWNTFVDSKRPKSRELPPLPHRRPSSEIGHVPTATPLPPINSHHYILEGIYHKEEPKDKRYPDISYSLYHLRENARPISPTGFRPSVLFVIGAVDEDVESLCTDLVDGVEQTAQHFPVQRLMYERMLVEGFLKLESVPSCALVEVIRKTVSSATADVLLISGFPRQDRDVVEWESWDLQVPDVFYVENLMDKLSGDVSEAERERLSNKNNDLLSVVDYLNGKYPEIVHRGDSVDRLKEAVLHAHNLQSHSDDGKDSVLPSAPSIHDENLDYLMLKEANLPVICFVGVPGAGKSSQSASSIHKYDMTRLSLKELAEKEIENSTARSEILKNSDLELIDADLAVDMMKEAMVESYTNTKGFILDGFPQSIEQGEKMQRDIGEFKAILNLQVTPQVAVTRLMERVTDQGVSDEDAESLCKSENEKSTERLQSVLDYYHHKVITISSNGSAAEVFENVSHILEGVLEIPEEPAEIIEPECVKEEVKEEVEATNTTSGSLPDGVPPAEAELEISEPLDEVQVPEDENIHREIENQIIEEGSLIADDTEADNIPLDSEIASLIEGNSPPDESKHEVDPESLVAEPAEESEKLEETEEIKNDSEENNISAAETNQPNDVDDEEGHVIEGEVSDEVSEDVAKTENGDEVEEVISGGDAVGEENSEKIDSRAEDGQPSEELVPDDLKDNDEEKDGSNREGDEVESLVDEIKPVLEVYRDDLKSGTE